MYRNPVDPALIHSGYPVTLPIWRELVLLKQALVVAAPEVLLIPMAHCFTRSFQRPTLPLMYDCGLRLPTGETGGRSLTMFITIRVHLC